MNKLRILFVFAIILCVVTAVSIDDTRRKKRRRGRGEARLARAGPDTFKNVRAKDSNGKHVMNSVCADKCDKDYGMRDAPSLSCENRRKKACMMTLNCFVDAGSGGNRFKFYKIDNDMKATFLEITDKTTCPLAQFKEGEWAPDGQALAVIPDIGAWIRKGVETMVDCIGNSTEAKRVLGIKRNKAKIKKMLAYMELGLFATAGARKTEHDEHAPLKYKEFCEGWQEAVGNKHGHKRCFAETVTGRTEGMFGLAATAHKLKSIAPFDQDKAKTLEVLNWEIGGASHQWAMFTDDEMKVGSSSDGRSEIFCNIPKDTNSKIPNQCKNSMLKTTSLCRHVKKRAKNTCKGELEARGIQNAKVVNAKIDCARRQEGKMVCSYEVSATNGSQQKTQQKTQQKSQRRSQLRKKKGRMLLEMFSRARTHEEVEGAMKFAKVMKWMKETDQSIPSTAKDWIYAQSTTGNAGDRIMEQLIQICATSRRLRRACPCLLENFKIKQKDGGKSLGDVYYRIGRSWSKVGEGQDTGIYTKYKAKDRHVFRPVSLFQRGNADVIGSASYIAGSKALKKYVDPTEFSQKLEELSKRGRTLVKKCLPLVKKYYNKYKDETGHTQDEERGRLRTHGNDPSKKPRNWDEQFAKVKSAISQNKNIKHLVVNSLTLNGSGNFKDGAVDTFANFVKRLFANAAVDPSGNPYAAPNVAFSSMMIATMQEMGILSNDFQPKLPFNAQSNVAVIGEGWDNNAACPIITKEYRIYEDLMDTLVKTENYHAKSAYEDEPIQEVL